MGGSTTPTLFQSDSGFLIRLGSATIGSRRILLGLVLYRLALAWAEPFLLACLVNGAGRITSLGAAASVGLLIVHGWKLSFGLVRAVT